MKIIAIGIFFLFISTQIFADNTKIASKTKKITTRECGLVVYGDAEIDGSRLQFNAKESKKFAIEEYEKTNTFTLKSITGSGEAKEARNFDFVTKVDNSIILECEESACEYKYKTFYIVMDCSHKIEKVQLFKGEKLIATAEVRRLSEYKAKKKDKGLDLVLEADLYADGTVKINKCYRIEKGLLKEPYSEVNPSYKVQTVTEGGKVIETRMADFHEPKYVRNSVSNIKKMVLILKSHSNVKIIQLRKDKEIKSECVVVR